MVGEMAGGTWKKRRQDAGATEGLGLHFADLGCSVLRSYMGSAVIGKVWED
jgi:hypothetical protein